MGKRKKLLAFFGFKKCGSEENRSGEKKYCESEEYRSDERSYHYQYQRKVQLGEEDQPWWYGEPDIDRKARDYINRFHHSINSQTE
jgi:hypothetical protein